MRIFTANMVIPVRVNILFVPKRDLRFLAIDRLLRVHHALLQNKQENSY